MNDIKPARAAKKDASWRAFLILPMLALFASAPACSSAPPPAAAAPATESAAAPQSDAPPPPSGETSADSSTSAPAEQRVARDPDPAERADSADSADVAASNVLADEKTSDKALTDPERQLVAKWFVDIESTLAAEPKYQALPDEGKKMALDIAKDRMGQVTLEFTKDRRVIAKFDGKTEEGTYAVKKVEGNRLILTNRSKSGKDEELTAELKNGKLRIVIKGQALFFKKKA